MTGFYEPEIDRGFTRVYKSETPEMLKAFLAFDAAVFAPDAEDGPAIPLKYRQLIALAVAITTQCPWCIDSHTKEAVDAGATDKELAEAAWVATAIRAGGGFAHGRAALKIADAHRH